MSIECVCAQCVTTAMSNSIAPGIEIETKPLQGLGNLHTRYRVVP